MAIPEEEFKITTNQLIDILNLYGVDWANFESSSFEFRQELKRICFERLDTVI